MSEISDLCVGELVGKRPTSREVSPSESEIVPQLKGGFPITNASNQETMPIGGVPFTLQMRRNYQDEFEQPASVRLFLPFSDVKEALYYLTGLNSTFYQPPRNPRSQRTLVQRFYETAGDEQAEVIMKIREAVYKELDFAARWEYKQKKRLLCEKIESSKIYLGIPVDGKQGVTPAKNIFYRLGKYVSKFVLRSEEKSWGEQAAEERVRKGLAIAERQYAQLQEEASGFIQTIKKMVDATTHEAVYNILTKDEKIKQYVCPMATVPVSVSAAKTSVLVN